jgi:hypothetical protein
LGFRFITFFLAYETLEKRISSLERAVGLPEQSEILERVDGHPKQGENLEERVYLLENLMEMLEKRISSLEIAVGYPGQSVGSPERSVGSTAQAAETSEPGSF